MFPSLPQILRDGELQSRSHRRQQTQSRDATGRRRDSKLQARKPDNVRMGDQRSAAGRGHLLAGQRAERLLHQSVSRRRIFDEARLETIGEN